MRITSGTPYPGTSQYFFHLQSPSITTTVVHVQTDVYSARNYYSATRVYLPLLPPLCTHCLSHGNDSSSPFAVRFFSTTKTIEAPPARFSLRDFLQPRLPIRSQPSHTFTAHPLPHRIEQKHGSLLSQRYLAKSSASDPSHPFQPPSLFQADCCVIRFHSSGPRSPPPMGDPSSRPKPRFPPIAQANSRSLNQRSPYSPYPSQPLPFPWSDSWPAAPHDQRVRTAVEQSREHFTFSLRPPPRSSSAADPQCSHPVTPLRLILPHAPLLPTHDPTWGGGWFGQVPASKAKNRRVEKDLLRPAVFLFWWGGGGGDARSVPSKSLQIDGENPSRQFPRPAPQPSTCFRGLPGRENIDPQSVRWPPMAQNKLQAQK